MDGCSFSASICFNVVGVALLLLANHHWPPPPHHNAKQELDGSDSRTPYLPVQTQQRHAASEWQSRRPETSREDGVLEVKPHDLMTALHRPRFGALEESKPAHRFEKAADSSHHDCKCGVCADMDPCCRAKDKRKVVYLAIMCKSAPGNFERRQKMRAAWAKAMRADSFYNSHVMDKLVHFSFVIGKSGKKEVDDSVDGESRLYNDTAVGNFKDTYQNLTSKLLWTLAHAQQTLRFRYLLMADDDAFINLSALTQWLVVSPNERFYSGMMEKDVLVVRDPESKWYVRRSFYGPKTYPPYHQGFGYVTSCDSVEDGMKYVNGIPLFGIDDTVMGMLMFVGGVKATHMPRFHSAPYYCQKFHDSHPLVIGDIESSEYDKYTKDLLDHGCGVCAGKDSKPPKSSAG